MELRFTYNNKLHKAIIGFAFFAVCAYVLFEKANSNTEPASLYFIQFNAAQATVLFYIMSAFCVLFVMISAYLMYTITQHHIELIIKDSQIFIPRIGMRKAIVIPFDQILRLETITVYRQVFLSVKMANGKYDFLKSRFETDEKYEDFKSILERSVIFE